MKTQRTYDLVVVGGGHAGAEAAWAAANLGARVALVTMDPSRIGAMSCNPAIGGLAKGQIVREIDALGGLMALATDATGIQFRVLNASKGPAVQGPRAQCDKYRYAREVQRLLQCRPQITIIPGTVDEILTDHGQVTGVMVTPSPYAPSPASLPQNHPPNAPYPLHTRAIVLTTGTFMRGLMHTGEMQTPGGRVGEGAAVSISHCLEKLGFELGRLKTGTPPRLAAESIDFYRLPLQPGDPEIVPFSDLTAADSSLADNPIYARVAARFPVQEQRPCHLTQTDEAIHQVIRANRDRAPLFNGQIDPGHIGPRYCPSIEDKVFRFADKTTHHVFLEPESLETNEIYCNGISTSLPADVQDFIVHHLPGCEKAVILRYGYAVEYDMVWPHQIDATGMTKRLPGLFLAGQINGTSGYEEAAGQGLIAGLNAVRFIRGQEPVRLGRDQAYIGVMMDDLVTKTPREPYRMFTSRAEYRLLLRSDNTDERLTPLGRQWGLVDDDRWRLWQRRSAALQALRQHLADTRLDGMRLADWARRPEVDVPAMQSRLTSSALEAQAQDPRLIARVLADLKYAGYIERQQRDVQRLAELERIALPPQFAYERVLGLRKEAVNVLARFKPATIGQASRLAGITPADLMLLSLAIGR